MFYCARMVSEQKDTEFQHDDYGELKKVYSIWIFMESPASTAHTISSYTMTHQCLYGDYEETERYDLMNIIAVRLAVDNKMEGGDAIHQMLETLFSSKMTVWEKEEKLEKEFGMRIKETVKEGANQFGELITALLADGLVDVVEQVAKDEKVRREYFKKYNIGC